MVRPDAKDLVPVGDEEEIVFFIAPRTWDGQRPQGQRIQESAMPSETFKPSPSNYGPSVFAVLLIRGGIEALLEHYPKWKNHGQAIVKAGKVRSLGLGVEVKLSPQDCTWEDFKNAHASLVGVVKSNRRAILALLDHHVVKEPDPLP